MQRILRVFLLLSIVWIVFLFVLPFLHVSSSRGLSAGGGMTVSIMILPEAFATTPTTDPKQINHKIETLKAMLSKEKTNEHFLKRLKTAEIASGHIRLQSQKPKLL